MARKVTTPVKAEPLDSEELIDGSRSRLPDHHEEYLAPTVFHAAEEDAGVRLDHFLVARIPDVSRVRVQQLVEQGKVLVNERTAKASLKLKGSEVIEITGTVEAAPLKAFAEDIPMEVVFEDKELAVVNKPAGMVVHASSGSAKTRATAERWSMRCCSASTSLATGRRPAAGDRAPAGQGHQRPDCGGEERRGAPQAGGAVFVAAGAQDLHCAGAQLAQERSRGR